jgi:hypothetical protein
MHVLVATTVHKTELYNVRLSRNHSAVSEQQHSNILPPKAIAVFATQGIRFLLSFSPITLSILCKKMESTCQQGGTLDTSTLDPLPPILKRGFMAVSFLGFLFGSTYSVWAVMVPRIF